MSLVRAKKLVAGLAALPALLSAGIARAEWGLNLPEPFTPMAREIMTLHNTIMAVCLIIFIVVFGAMFYSLWAHRKSRGHKPAQFSHSTTMEIIWTIIPFFILVGMAVPSTATLIRMEDTTDADLSIKITGYQWKWHYEYLDSGVNFFSTLSTSRDQIENKAEKTEHYLLEVDNPLIIPAGRKVRLLTTANDVIHSWWVPHFGVKKDAIPGYINETWVNVDKPGTYRGQCTELCGRDHGYMPVVVEVLAGEEYDKWAAGEAEILAAK